MEVSMKIERLLKDPITDMPIVLLRDPENETVLPIWVGEPEANAIALKIEDVATPRPMTHDLIKNLLDNVGASLVKVVITDLVNNTFYARILLEHQGETLSIDSRPSDAIAVALRTNSPIFVATKVIDLASTNSEPAPEAQQSERLRKWLESLDAEDMGQYEM